MGLLQEFRDSLSSVVSFPADYFAGWFGVAPSESGVEVNELTAMQIAAYVGCVRIISGAIATLPFRVWETLADGTERLATEHALDRVLNDQPNPEVTAADFWETVMVHILQTGNAYAEKSYNGAGMPAAMYLRSPFRTFPYRDKNGQLFYKTNDTSGNYERHIPAENVVHIKGMGLDSLVGLSPVKYYAREALGIDLAAQSYGAKFFANDSRPGGYLSAPNFLAPEKKKAGINSWIAAHSRGNSHTMAFLDGGVTWNKVGVNPEEAQFLQTRKFNREQIAAIFGVPVHFLGESVESRANMEQRGMEFLTYTLKPFLVKIEQSVNSKMFPRVAIGRNAGRVFHARMDTTMFDRPTYADLLKGVQTGRFASVMTLGESRKALGLQPYTGKQLKSDDINDKLLQPVNMVVVTEDTLSGQMPTQVVDDLDKPNKGKGQGGNDQDGGDGDGKPASVTGQGGKRSDAEIQRYSLIFSRSFESALARILARKKRSEKDFQQIFEPVLATIAATFSFRADAEDQELSPDICQFIKRYISAMAKRGAEWKTEAEKDIRDQELHRALSALRDKISVEEDERQEKNEQSRGNGDSEIVELRRNPEQPNLTIPITLHIPRTRKVTLLKTPDGVTTGAKFEDE